MNKGIIAFLNAYTQGISGGDLRFIEISKRIFPKDLFIVTSYLGRKLCIENGLTAKYLITTKETNFKNIILTYIKRVPGALVLLKKHLTSDIILYSTSDFFPDVIPAFLLKLLNKNNKWIQIIHHLIPNPVSRKGGFLRNCISFLTQRVSLLLIRNKADKIIAIGPLLANKLISSGFKDSKVEVGYNGINIREIERLRIDSNINRYDAVFMGRLHPSKGIEDLIEVWKLLKLENKKYTLAIIGKGEPKFIQYLKHKIKDYNLENYVFLLGYVEEGLHYLKTAKAFVFPSYEEGWGISICEALACGVPVVAYDLPVYNDIYNDSIIKVPKGNIEMFCNKIIESIENKDFRTRIIEIGKQICQRYDWDNVARRELGIIEK